MRDEVNEPLGLGPRPNPRRTGFGPGAARVLLGLAVAVGGAGGLWLWTVGAFDRDRPLAVARIEAAEMPVAPPPAMPAAPPPSTPAADARPASSPIAGGVSAFSSGEQLEAASGVKVTRGGGGGPPNALIIDVPQALGFRLAPAPDPRLVEKSRHGSLPRIGADGARPADVYARPIAVSAKLRGAPRIAIVVGGLGLDAASTAAAISRLPGAVSLGFAPYGDDLPAAAARARDAGHEILLQAPMEGFGAAPGPHTLSTTAIEADNRDQLQWMMSRFPGFVGVENYLGAKFTADSQAFAPTLAELSGRGLLYLDDGSSPRSLTGAIASGFDMRAAKADVVIDTTPSADAIEAALARLETLARHQDGVIGVATALPITLEHLAHWAEALESRGIALTPVSALVARGSIRSAGATP